MIATEMTVAQIILQQLGGRRFTAMTGAKNYVDHNGALSMQLPSRLTKGRGNYLKITLNGSDLYDISYSKFSTRTLDNTVIATRSNVFVENLHEVFTELTGLDTHL